jgi:cytochrome c556
MLGVLRTKLRVQCAAHAIFLLALASSMAHADDGDVIDYRKHIMDTLDEHAQALMMIADHKGPAANFNLHTKALALASSQAVKAFEPEVQGGDSKADVWKAWKDFSAKMDQLVTNLVELDKTAQAGGMAAATPKIKSFLSCQGCHEAYLTKPLSSGKSQNDAADAVQYRRHVMSSLDAQASALGQILSMDIPDANLASHLQVIAVTAAGALKAFEPKVPGGEAKPDVWSNWADFSQKMNDFAQKTAAAAKVAQGKGNNAALAGVMDALTCKGCHDTYREKK